MKNTAETDESISSADLPCFINVEWLQIAMPVGMTAMSKAYSSLSLLFRNIGSGSFRGFIIKGQWIGLG